MLDEELFTPNSLICRELFNIYQENGYSENPNEILAFFKENHNDIVVKYEEPYVIFNYAIGANFSDPIVQEARGIIIKIIFMPEYNRMTFKVVCWPFRKFGKYDDDYADSIDWNSAYVTEKLDGCILKVWRNGDSFNGTIMVSSMSCIDAKDAAVDPDNNTSLYDILKWALTTDNLTLEDIVDYDFTTILELTSPYNRIVIPYDIPEIHLIGIRNNLTGKELDIYEKTDSDYKMFPKVKRPKKYGIHTLDECVSSLIHENKIAEVKQEGYVVVDKDFHRVKIKSPEYMIMHHIVDITAKSKTKLLELLYNDDINVDELSKEFPDLSHILKYYSYQLEETLYDMRAMVNISRRLYKAFYGDRKSVANKIKTHKYSAIGFLAITFMDLSPIEVIEKKYGIQKVFKLVPNYHRYGWDELFEGIDEIRNSIKEANIIDE